MRLLIGLATSLLAAHVLAQPPASVAQGNYECWGNGSPRLLLNFKVTGRDRYTDPDAKERGSFAYDTGSGAITFNGGHLDGVMPNGFTSVYHENKNKPTVSFRSARGSESSFCERVGK